MGSSFVTAEVDGKGRLLLPPLLARRAGIPAGSRVRVSEEEGGLRIGRSVHTLARLYLEPTSECNLACPACIRADWHEPSGRMSGDTWERILSGIRNLDPLPSLFLGGFGEPLLHPDIMDMVSDAKLRGMHVELITNATLLDERTAARMVDCALDRLWVSLDGAEEGLFAAARGGGSLEDVVDHVQGVNAARERSRSDSPRIGISFVATKDTISSLPRVLRLGVRLTADRFTVSNILPHTLEMSN